MKLFHCSNNEQVFDVIDVIQVNALYRCQLIVTFSIGTFHEIKTISY